MEEQFLDVQEFVLIIIGPQQEQMEFKLKKEILELTMSKILKL
jgi:hypothetical protein